MPIYEYRCNDCQQIFEEWQKNFEERETPCPVCGAKSKRIMSNTSFVLKGSGWYVTDYCRNGAGNGGAKTDAPDASGSDAGSASGSSADASAPAAPAASPAPKGGDGAAAAKPASSDTTASNT
jgi:putative FmdB family regulatory protein